MRALMVIPTYNEANNIGPLLDRLFDLDLTGVETELNVMVMDDNSPDGTSQIVDKLSKTEFKGKLFLETGVKQGLGVALQKSFDLALNKYDHDVILTMDADHSHDPADVPKLLQAIYDGADVAIGSRYTQGGMIPGDWPLFFLVRTHVATKVARWLGGVDPTVNELTTNMRAVRRNVLKEVPYSRIKAKGYAFQIVLANELTKEGINMVEVPIAFHSRNDGETKSRFIDILEFFRVAYQLNSDSPAKQVLRFATVGATGVAVNLASLALIQNLSGSNSPLTSLAAIQISIIWNFVFHTLFTFRNSSKFKEKLSIGSAAKNYFAYNASVSLVQLLTLVTYTTLSSAGAYYLLAQFVGICLSFSINYYVSKTYVWTNRKVTAN